MSAGNGQGRRRLRIAVAMTLLGLAGCADNTRAPQAPPPAFIDVKIEPQGRIQPAQARRLATMIAEEAQRRHLMPQDQKLNGVVDAGRARDGLYLVTVIDVSNGKGKRLHRIVDDSMQPAQSLSDAELRTIAASAVAKLALWRAATDDTTGSIAPARDVASSAAFDVAPLGPDETIAAASIAAIVAAKPMFEITIGPAPGDGAEALKAALEDQLAKMPPIGDAGHYDLRGEVAISSRDDGDVDIAIRWQLASADGRLVGAVTQKRAVAPSKIASYWGDLATAAAAPAASGILEMLKPASRLPGNAS